MSKGHGSTVAPEIPTGKTDHLTEELPVGLPVVSALGKMFLAVETIDEAHGELHQQHQSGIINQTVPRTEQ